MTSPAADRGRRRAEYLDSISETDSHTATCGACQAGAGCGTGDLLMDLEYRRVEELRAADPYTARALDRATWPTEEG